MARTPPLLHACPNSLVYLFVRPFNPHARMYLPSWYWGFHPIIAHHISSSGLHQTSLPANFPTQNAIKHHNHYSPPLLINTLPQLISPHQRMN